MSRSIRDQAEIFHDYSIHAVTRTIWLGSEEVFEDGESGTDAKMLEKLAKNLHVLDSSSDAPITIMMNNIGGDWYSGMGIYSLIRACRSHVTIKVVGSAMSMGSVILQAADKRILMPYSRVMIHYGEEGVHGHSKIVKNWAKEYERISQEMIDIYMEKIREKHPQYTKHRLDQLLNFDTVLTAQQAVNLGLADEIEGAT